MKTVMVRYKTSEAGADPNAESIRAVFDELRALAPKDFRYASYRMPDGVSFVHIATHAAPPAENPLTSLPAFKAFQAKLKERCVEPPVVTELSPVDAYEARA